MNFKKDKNNISIGRKTKTAPKRLSLGLHIMPKTEHRYFQKWLLLAVLIFALMVLLVLFILK